MPRAEVKMTQDNEMPQAKAGPGPGPALAFLADAAACLRFYSRLPVPALPFEAAPHAMPDFSRAVRALPLAGAAIGLVGALAFLLATGLGFGTYLAACAAVAALLVATGVFHEDGLADTADGLWGGATPERRLTIMRDSRVGSYGAAALTLDLMIRVGLIAALAGRMPALATALALVAAAAASRTVGLLPFLLLKPARSDGAAHAAGQPTQAAFATAAAGSAVIAFLLLLPAGFGFLAIVLALALAASAGAGLSRIARAKIGGHTGDIAGAAQQAGEIAFLAGLLALAPLAGAS
ncbi:adenosylcobinamide-GDP ribazoletransferase [Chelatococcus sp. GW1]|uniref:adenosylcobinamide-GDP ribazoletransferase n=2 Tax=unclassified Chelatococcus TaxID=2638111 RepID=UPI000305F59F